jgi:hypothetical protein
MDGQLTVCINGRRQANANGRITANELTYRKPVFLFNRCLAVCTMRYVGNFLCVNLRKPGGSRWNFFANLHRNGDTGTSGMVVAILIIWLPDSRWSITNSAIELSDPGKTEEAVGISLLSCIEADIQEHPVRNLGCHNLEFLISGFSFEPKEPFWWHHWVFRPRQQGNSK